MNGVLTDTLSKTYTMGSNNKAFSISTSSQSFDGRLDDVRYYNRALSDSEVAGIYGETSTNRVYLADALGSIAALTDTGKVIQTEYDYEPFGATTASGASSANSYKFTSREDDGTGLYYYRARYYHPALGRFVSEDPIEYAGGDYNLFAYGQNSPLYIIDPLGLLGEANPITDGVSYYNNTQPHDNLSGPKYYNDTDLYDTLSALLTAFDLFNPVAPGPSGEGLGPAAAIQCIKGAKRAADYWKHIRKLQQANKQLEQLKKNLERAVGPKAQGPIREQIKKLLDEIKGHEKEIGQKWPNGPPTD